MSAANSQDFSANAARFSGFAALYDQHRPQPPAALLDYLTRLVAPDLTPQSPLRTQVNCVVDLGSGTGLSTRAWAERAAQIVGIEPSDDMRRQAEAMTPHPHIRYQAGYSHATGLPDASADLVTCSQSLHWMEPNGTFAEAARILRPGGIFCAYDNDWPPATPSWEADAAFLAVLNGSHAVEKKHHLSKNVQRWEKEGHLGRMQASGYFRYCWEIVVHNQEIGNAERLMGLALSQGGVMTLLKNNIPESDFGLDRLRDIATRTLADDVPFLFCYRARLGVV